MPPYTIIRSLILALVASLSADSNDKASLDAANAARADLQKQLDDAKAALATDEGKLANLGTPLSDEETTHLSDLLGAVQAAPPIAVDPAPAPPADAGGQSQG